MTFDKLARNEKKWSLVAAVVMHLLFLALLVFGVSWQKRDTDNAMVVDLWSDLPPPTHPKAEVPPEPVKPPPPPKPEPKPVPKPPPPPPKPEVKPTVKPDIALKEKREKERKQEELDKAEKARKQKEKELEAQREKERKDKERQQAEQKKREAEKAAQLKAQQQKDAAAKAAAEKAAKEQQEAMARQAAAAATAEAKMIDEYKRRIHDKIQRLVLEPPNLDPKAEVEFDVVVIPGGEVLSARLKRSSNASPAYVSAVERAILRAQPLPLPPDPTLAQRFRELNLVFRPKD